MPVLELYATPVPGLSIARALMIIFTIVSLLRGTRLVPGLPLAPLVLTVALTNISLVAVIVSAQPGVILETLSRILVLITWALAVATMTPTFIDHKRVAIWIVAVAILATSYIALQTLYWRLVGEALPSLLDLPPYIKPSQPGYTDLATLSEHYRAFSYRPPSFFGEPQYYSDYASLALILTLFHPAIKAKAKLSIALTLGLILSMSATALGVGAVIWLCFAVSRRRAFRITPVHIVLGALGVVSIYAYRASLTAYIAPTLNKLINGTNGARIGGSFERFAELDGVQMLIGRGLGLEESATQGTGQYINSVTAILIGTGVLGGICLFMYFLYLITITNGMSRLMVLVYLALSLTGSALYSDRGFVWLALAFAVYSANNPPDSNAPLHYPNQLGQQRG